MEFEWSVFEIDTINVGGAPIDVILLSAGVYGRHYMVGLRLYVHTDRRCNSWVHSKEWDVEVDNMFVVAGRWLAEKLNVHSRPDGVKIGGNDYYLDMSGIYNYVCLSLGDRLFEWSKYGGFRAGRWSNVPF